MPVDHQRRFNRPLFLLRNAKSSAPKPTHIPTHMESDLQRASSSHALPSTIGIVDETPSLTGQLGPFHADPPFTSLRAIDNVAPQQPLQTANQAQNAIDLAGSAQQAQDNGMALLQSASQPFQQATYDGLTADATASTSFAGQLQGMKLIPNPPDLEYWRNRLFHVDEVITMSEEQYVHSLCPEASSPTDELLVLLWQIPDLLPSR